MSAGILIVDDDCDLSSMLAEFLGNEGFQVAATSEGGSALGLIGERPFDLVLLDVMLPGSSGFDVLREIRRRKPYLPVLMLTARGETIDRVLGLELGADDYLPKPFDPRELAARVRAILRRAASVGDNAFDSEGPESLVIGALKMDVRRRRTTLGSTTFELTGAEFRVLQHLVESRGQPVHRRLLTERALGRTLTLYDRSIDTHVSNLRRKLERQGRSGIEIRSVRGTGYELIETESA